MNAKKLVVFGLALVLVVGSLGGIFIALVKDDGSSSSSSSSTSSTSSTTSTTRVEFTGTGSAAFCAADSRLNAAIAQQAPTASDAASLQADFQRRVDAVKELATVAPAEIAPDVQAISAAYQQLLPALNAVGFDMSKVPQAERAAAQTPAVTLAGQRISQYTQRICKENTAP